MARATPYSASRVPATVNTTATAPDAHTSFESHGWAGPWSVGCTSAPPIRMLAMRVLRSFQITPSIITWWRLSAPATIRNRPESYGRRPATPGASRRIGNP